MLKEELSQKVHKGEILPLTAANDYVQNVLKDK